MTNDTTAIILDPSVEGNENGNTSNREEATWSVTFPYGTVSGIASCNSFSGQWGTTYSGNQNNITAGYQTDQMNCWCRMTYPVRSAWVVLISSSSASACASQCASNCGYSIRDYKALRQALFGSAGN